MKKTTMRTIAIVLGILAALKFAGDADYQEAKDQQARYCENVASGVWPDYKGNASEVCHGK